jgi:hypothetical protein
MAIRFLNSQNIEAGTLTVSTIANLAAASNFFLVSDEGLVKYRTATQVRSDIGAGTGSGTVTSVVVTNGVGISASVANASITPNITITNTDRGSSQLIFKNIAVSGQTTVVADSNNDTITFANGSNITITTNAATDTITIASINTNNFLSGLAWSTATGILTANRTGLSALTVDLNGRYPENNGTGASGTWIIDISGNATTANTLQNARLINGVSFNGSANITVADNTKEPAFSKNTAFNKAFGTAAGTVAEGSHDHDRNFITDSRGVQRLPSYYHDRYAQWDFQSYVDTLAGGDVWHGILTVAKWDGYHVYHRQEQLFFTGDDLKRRTATSDTTWGPVKTIWDSNNLNPNNFTVSSDIRLKENIKTLTTTKINSDYKTFNFTDDDTKQTRTGVIAQELEVNHPEFVRTDSKGMKSVSYGDLHSAEIAYLKSENEMLKAKLELIMNKLGI